MARSIWNGAVSFGAVDVPVKVYSATESKTVHFRELHEADGSEIRHELVDPDGKPVDRQDVVKGFEVRQGEFVVLSDDEVKAAAGEKIKTVDIEHFVPREQIDPDYYERPYYLAPQDGAEEGYLLLAHALDKTGRVGIGRVVMRTREQLVAVLPADGMLRMHTMRFAGELANPPSVDGKGSGKQPDQRMVKMASSLVDSLSARFKPEKYEDTYRERVLDLVKRKAKGEEIDTSAAEPEEAPDDLMAALQASLDAKKAKR
jgi:DNA end-binding protein Ku